MTGSAIAPPAAPSACTVFINGQVHTIDAQQSVAEAAVVRDGRIAYVGSNQGAQALAGAAARVIDLRGRMLMPGIVDAHQHPFFGGRLLQSCNLDYLPLTRDEFFARVGQRLAQDGADATAPLQVQGWYRDYMQPPGTTITRADLDALSATRPIVLTNRDQHTKVLNSAALAFLHIDEGTPQPTDGRIGRDADGRLNGLFEDGAALMINERLPKPTFEDDLTAARAAATTLSRLGVTTVLDALATPESLAPFAALRDAGELPLRFFGAGLIAGDRFADPAAVIAYLGELRERYASPITADQGSIQILSGKIFIDGVLQFPTQSAALLSPYLVDKGGPGLKCWCAGHHRGDIYVDPGRMNTLIPALADAGYDIHIHAIGDRAVRLALDGIAHARARHPGASYRPAIAHDELVDAADVPRFAALNVCPVMSFQWAVPGPNSVTAVKDHLGPARFAHMEPISTLARAGARVAYGSDWPVDKLNYWKSLKGGIDRTGDGRYGAAYAGTLNDEPGISRALALQSATIHAAWTLHLDHALGSIEPGKLADLIVLDRDVMQAPLEDWPDTRVLMTMLGGRIVFEEPELA